MGREHSDVPDRFHEGMQLLALSEEGTRRELQSDLNYLVRLWRVIEDRIKTHSLVNISFGQ